MRPFVWFKICAEVPSRITAVLAPSVWKVPVNFSVPFCTQYSPPLSVWAERLPSVPAFSVAPEPMTSSAAGAPPVVTFELSVSPLTVIVLLGAPVLESKVTTVGFVCEAPAAITTS